MELSELDAFALGEKQGMKNIPVVTAIVIFSIIGGAIAPKVLGREGNWQGDCAIGQSSAPCYPNSQSDNLGQPLPPFFWENLNLDFNASGRRTLREAPEMAALQKIGALYIGKFDLFSVPALPISIASISREQQAEQLYAMGRLAEAAQILQEILQNREEATLGDKLSRARVLRNLALVYQEMGERSRAEEIITQSLNLLCGDIACQASKQNGRESRRLVAETLEVRGKLQFAGGRAETALETWKQAALYYEEIEDITGTTRSQINQTQALRNLGLYREAIDTLRAVNENLAEKPDTLLKAQALQSLGDALRLVGRGQESQEILQESLAISEKLSSGESIASVMLSLGNAARSSQDPEIAFNFYRKAALDSPSLDIRLQARLNWLSLLVEKQEWSQARELIPEIQSDLSEFPLSRTAVNARINLASSLMNIPIADDGQCPLPNIGVGAKHLNRELPGEGNIFAEMLRPYKIKSQKSKVKSQKSFCNVANAELLATAVKMARSLGDKRAESNALGNLGRLYEQNQQWDDARELTEQGLLLAQAIDAGDIAYQWQWQLGRILKVQGERESAIAAYSQSVKTLQSLRGDLVAISSEVQFNFRETVEPVYRQLVALLLEPSLTKDGAASRAEIIKARETIELLQLAELDNFFRDACLETQPIQIEDIDAKAAVIYTIILPDRLEAIVTLPGQNLRHYSTELPQQQIEGTLQQMQFAVTNQRLRRAIGSFLSPSQQVYNWLIRPIEADLATSGVETLVFVLDGAFRNIPIAALYDGDRYLTEKYKVALTPGLQLLNSEPLVSEQLQAFAAGLTQARQGFSALPAVGLELQSIGSEVPTEILLNHYFTKSNFKETINNLAFPVIHIATHGQFSSLAAETFILTWDDRINVVELDSILRTDEGRKNPIELLVLSACQTAVGDRRAALGLAGVAVRAGARSTIASLWFISDRATAKLMTRFYQELANSDASKAEALRLAQLAVLQEGQFSHPYYWSAFVLVGNWL